MTDLTTWFPSVQSALMSGGPVLADHLIADLVDNAIRHNTAAGDI